MNEKLLAATKKTIEQSDPYKGYPTTRLVLNEMSLQNSEPLLLPDGPWTMNNTNLPSPEESQAFRDAGYATDTDGRPLHPWLKEMITDPDVGVVTGKGAYWHWGPNYTADPVVLATEEIDGVERQSVLLIKRVDTGAWALPGGFVDKGETDHHAVATRELYEETNLDIPVDGELIYEDVVADLRTTAHSWAETSAYLFEVDQRMPVIVTDPEEVEEVAWFYLDELPDELHGSHAVLINMAIERSREPKQQSIREILNKPSSELEVVTIDAGHMAYDHMTVSDGVDTLFLKAHDASRFTDEFREMHSRAYLEKEYFDYEYVRRHGFAYVPDRFDLIDGTILAMNAFTKQDGWLWDISSEQMEAFTRDFLEAVDELQKVPAPVDPEFHKLIKPTFETFWEEGWDDITDEKMELIINKITTLSANWSAKQRQWADELIQDLPLLRKQAAQIDRHPELFMAHNDARLSNLAWNPTLSERRVRFVDWSWADPAPKNADATMLLIDNVKAGYDVTQFYNHVNKDQAIVLTGFWLAHSLWNTRDGSTTVREQQVASASAAHRLLKQLPK